jgi:GT2 family glycosyltransferase
MSNKRIAVLITCHNRRDKTLKCFEALYKQESIEDLRLQVYLVDDGCTDGTAEAIIAEFPETRILKGSGSLYWCGGMRLAWEEARKDNYDYYLWLNDDTTLAKDALRSLLRTSMKISSRELPKIIVGSTCDPDTGCRTYGGIVRAAQLRPLDLYPVVPCDKPQECTTMNGNCVLIPREISRSVGNLSSEFTHGLGDIDYGLRATKLGYSIWLTPGYVGICPRNSGPAWTSSEISFRKRWRLLHSPKGFIPQEWMVFVRRHTGFRWPWYMIKVYLRVILPSLWKLAKR